MVNGVIERKKMRIPRDETQIRQLLARSDGVLLVEGRGITCQSTANADNIIHAAMTRKSSEKSLRKHLILTKVRNDTKHSDTAVSVHNRP